MEFLDFGEIIRGAERATNINNYVSDVINMFQFICIIWLHVKLDYVLDEVKL